jgi:outer membrane protein assembly factor BamD (BamD/ComL family)
MNRCLLRGAVAAACLLVLTETCPAPIIYRPGEGWTYEPVGSEGAKWVRKRAKDQLAVAQDAFDRKEYGLARKAARRVVKTWPLSDYAGRAQYLIGRIYEARKMDERAFKEYQKALTKYPKLSNYDEIIKRQFAISTRFLGGQWFKLWGYIPFFPSMDKTANLFEQVVKNGPYHETGPTSQMDIGTAREKQKNYPQAVKAYQKAADRYFDRPQVAADAIYKTGKAWEKQAKRADYDQSIAKSSIESFQDLATLYPKDPRIPETEKVIASLRTEQARGAYNTAKYYEHHKRYLGALVYYNEVLAKDRNSIYALEARQRIEKLKPKAEKQREGILAYERKLRDQTRAAGTNLPPDRPTRR